MSGSSQNHDGVSCDGCLLPNFTGNRYKCLRCYDFDLCHQCYVNDRFNGNPGAVEHHHEQDHPMQCILTHHDFDLLYEGDPSRSYDQCKIVVCTCPYCGRNGFSHRSFFEHIVKEHPEPPFAGHVNCPLCIGSPDMDSNREVENMRQHVSSIHPNLDPSHSTSTYRGASAIPGDPVAAQTRNGTRRPMLARRTARQPAGGNANTAGGGTAIAQAAAGAGTAMAQAAVAAAHFGLPWSNDFDDVNEMFRMMNLERLPASFTNAPDLSRFRAFQPLANAMHSSRLGRGGLGGPTYSQVTSGVVGAPGASEYAAPRSARPPASLMVNVVRAVGTRSVYPSVYDDSRRRLPIQPDVLSEDDTQDTGSDGSGAHFLSAEEGSADEGSKRRVSSELPELKSPEPEEELSDSEFEFDDEPQSEQESSEEETLKEVESTVAEGDVLITEDEAINLEKANDPFAGKRPNPLKALRANTSDTEWKAIRNLLRGEGDMDDGEPEGMIDDSRRATTSGADDDDQEKQVWLTLELDTSGLAFANESYWKDKRFLKNRRSMQRKTYDGEDPFMLQKAAVAAAIVRTASGGQIPNCREYDRRGRVARKTLQMFDFKNFNDVDVEAHSESDITKFEDLLEASRRLESRNEQGTSSEKVEGAAPETPPVLPKVDSDDEFSEDEDDNSIYRRLDYTIFSDWNQRT